MAHDCLVLERLSTPRLLLFMSANMVWSVQFSQQKGFGICSIYPNIYQEYKNTSNTSSHKCESKCKLCEFYICIFLHSILHSFHHETLSSYQYKLVFCDENENLLALSKYLIGNTYWYFRGIFSHNDQKRASLSGVRIILSWGNDTLHCICKLMI